jgi:hypothetical protein
MHGYVIDRRASGGCGLRGRKGSVFEKQKEELLFNHCLHFKQQENTKALAQGPAAVGKGVKGLRDILFLEYSRCIRKKQSDTHRCSMG